MLKEARENGTSGGIPLVYRSEALEAHRRSRQFSTESRFISASTGAKLWAASLASLALVVWVARTPVPAYVSGRGVVVLAEQLPGIEGSGLGLVASFPPEARERLAAGQRLRIDMGAHGAPVEARLTRIEPQLLEPEAAAARFGWKEGARGAAVYAVAVFALPEPQALAAGGVGATFRVEVEVGQQRLFESFSPAEPSSKG